MFQQVDTRVPHEVEREVSAIYHQMFADAQPGFVSTAFDWVGECFVGQFDGFQAIDARYHDLEHTLQGTLCFARLLHGRHEARVEPVLIRKMFELGLLAILFHDTGYLKKREDNGGTGAKYTLVHVARSAAFASDYLGRKGFPETDILAIQNMIRCTGVNVDLAAIPFHSELERIVGYALSTSDLLGQMAARDYIDKLPILYQEFAEAARYSGDRSSRASMFSSAEDLMRKTPGFWEKYVWPRINGEFRGLYKFLAHPYPEGTNHYLDRVRENLRRLEGMTVSAGPTLTSPADGREGVGRGN